VPAHQHHRPFPQRSRQSRPERPVADEHVRIAGHVAYFEQRRALTEKAAHVENGPQRLPGYAEGNHTRRMAVHHGLHVAAGAIYLGVDEALQIHPLSACVDRHAVEVENEDIVAPDEPRRHVAGKQEMAGRLVVPHAHVPEAIDNALPVKDPVGEYKLVDKRAIDKELEEKLHSAIKDFKGFYRP